MQARDGVPLGALDSGQPDGLGNGVELVSPFFPPGLLDHLLEEWPGRREAWARLSEDAVNEALAISRLHDRDTQKKPVTRLKEALDVVSGFVRLDPREQTAVPRLAARAPESAEVTRLRRELEERATQAYETAFDEALGKGCSEEEAEIVAQRAMQQLHHAA